MGRKKIVKLEAVADSPKFSNTAKYRNLVFTLNNYVDNSLDKLKDWDQITYLIAGKEIAPNTGTPHLQGYFELKTSVLGSTIKNRIPTAHLEPRFGTAKQAADYCKKDGDIFIEQGNISHQGERTDLQQVVDSVVEGRPMKEIADEYPLQYVKYHKGLQALRSITIKPRNTAPTIYVLYGSSGVGKSRKARELIGNNDYYKWTPGNGQWFDGYDAHTHVIFEEYRGEIPIGHFLDLMDEYDAKVQLKGSMMQFVATFIVITSSVHPRYWNVSGGICGLENKTKQMMRRFTHVINMDDSVQNPYLLTQKYKERNDALNAEEAAFQY